MSQDNDKPKPPWWSEQADEDTPLPDNYPEPPDLAKVTELRAKLKKDKAAAGAEHHTPLHSRIAGKDKGKSARDIGSYTMIPMMMLVGPMIGFLMGHWIEGRFGGEPWWGVGGVFVGLAAAVKQIIIMLQRRSRDNGDKT